MTRTRVDPQGAREGQEEKMERGREVRVEVRTGPAQEQTKRDTPRGPQTRDFRVTSVTLRRDLSPYI